MSLSKLGLLEESKAQEFIDKVDDAVAAGACALYFDTRYQVVNLDLFTWEDTRFTAEEWLDAANDADSLDQLMVFAFGDAPRAFVENWLKRAVTLEQTDSDADSIVTRLANLVEYMRSGMPALIQEWEGRRSQTARSIGDVNVDLVIEPERGVLTARLSADAFYSSGAKLAPISSSRTHFDVRLSRSDMERLISQLEETVQRIDELQKAVEG